MGSCNTTQKELGGKSLKIKACQAVSIKTVDESETLELVAPPSGFQLSNGDIIKFLSVGANTAISAWSASAPKYYKVVNYVSNTNFKVAEVDETTPIEMDASEATISADAFVAIGGIRSKTFSLGVDGIDITNEDSDEWTTLLDGAGIRSAEISGEGVFVNSQKIQALEDDMIANNLVCLMFLEEKSFRMFDGCFKVTSLEYSGGHDGEGTMSISASSSGKVYSKRGQ